MKVANDKENALLEASIEALKAGNPKKLIGPFTAGLVYAGLNCSVEHRQAVQDAYNSLPALVQAAFERTGFHIEGCGSNLDMATRLACEPPAMALGVTNYPDNLVMIAEYSFGPNPETGKGIVVGTAATLSPINSTLAHEIGHVLDKCCPERGTRGNGKAFIKALIEDIEVAEVAAKAASDPKTLYSIMQSMAANATDPSETFAEAFAFAIGFGGTARGDDFALRFPKSIEYVRGWFERNYDKITAKVSA